MASKRNSRRKKVKKEMILISSADSRHARKGNPPSDHEGLGLIAWLRYIGRKWKLTAVLGTICVVGAFFYDKYTDAMRLSYETKNSQAEKAYERLTKDLEQCKKDESAMKIVLGYASVVQHARVPVAFNILEPSSWHRREVEPNLESVRALLSAHRQYLSGVNLSFVDLTGVELRGAQFQRADCFGAVFRGADLQDADFTKAEIDNTCFEGADLRRVRAYQCQAAGANFRKADLRNGCFDGANFMPVISFSMGPDTSPNNASRDVLRGRYQQGYVLDAAVFEGARLAGATFREAFISGVNTTNADFSSAVMVGAYRFPVMKPDSWLITHNGEPLPRGTLLTTGK